MGRAGWAACAAVLVIAFSGLFVSSSFAGAPVGVAYAAPSGGLVVSSFRVISVSGPSYITATASTSSQSSVSLSVQNMAPGDVVTVVASMTLTNTSPLPLRITEEVTGDTQIIRYTDDLHQGPGPTGTLPPSRSVTILERVAVTAPENVGQGATFASITVTFTGTHAGPSPPPLARPPSHPPSTPQGP